MISLATPLGEYMQEVAQNITDAFITVGNKATSEENIGKHEDMWQDKIDNMTDIDKYTQYHNEKIPTGGWYYVGLSSTDLTYDESAKATFKSGDTFPVPQIGDVYKYREYIYKYGYENDGTQWVPATCGTSWGVAVIDNTQTDYEEPIIEINNEKITCYAHLFQNNTDILTGVAFHDDTTHLTETYSGCSMLIDYAALPTGTTEFVRTFAGCEAIIKAPKLHEGITSIEGMFDGCTLLVKPPQLPSTLKNMSYAFNNCTVLEYVPPIPEAVENMDYAFANCDEITSSSSIPASVVSVNGTFKDCDKLRGTIAINSTRITSYVGMFENCARTAELEIKIAGVTPANIKKAIAQSGYNGGQYMKYIDDTGILKPAK
jgi:hypothetical protein